jgi:hypothetical protein
MEKLLEVQKNRVKVRTAINRGQDVCALIGGKWYEVEAIRDMYPSTLARIDGILDWREVDAIKIDGDLV